MRSADRLKANAAVTGAAALLARYPDDARRLVAAALRAARDEQRAARDEIVRNVYRDSLPGLSIAEAAREIAAAARGAIGRDEAAKTRRRLVRAKLVEAFGSRVSDLPGERRIRQLLGA